jgi:hypothetical protein
MMRAAPPSTGSELVGSGSSPPVGVGTGMLLPVELVSSSSSSSSSPGVSVGSSAALVVGAGDSSAVVVGAGVSSLVVGAGVSSPSSSPPPAKGAQNFSVAGRTSSVGWC